MRQPLSGPDAGRRRQASVCHALRAFCDVLILKPTAARCTPASGLATATHRHTARLHDVNWALICLAVGGHAKNLGPKPGRAAAGRALIQSVDGVGDRFIAGEA